MIRAYPDDLPRRKEWKRLAEQAGILIVEDDDLLAAEKQAAIAEAMRDFGYDSTGRPLGSPGG